MADETVTDPSNPTEPTKEPAKEPSKEPPKPKPDDHEGRITELSGVIKELKTKLKERDDADKRSTEEKLKEEGKLKELLESKEKELTELLPLKDQLKAHEEAITANITSTIEGIEDEEKRGAVEKMLEGLSVLDQYRKLPELLKLVGSPADTSFGGKTPAGEKDAGKTTKEQQEARFDELTVKQTKGEKLTPQEEREYNKLMMALSSFIPK